MRRLGGIEKEGGRSKTGEGRCELCRHETRFSDAHADDRPLLGRDELNYSRDSGGSGPHELLQRLALDAENIQKPFIYNAIVATIARRDILDIQLGCLQHGGRSAWAALNCSRFRSHRSGSTGFSSRTWNSSASASA